MRGGEKGKEREIKVEYKVLSYFLLLEILSGMKLV